MVGDLNRASRTRLNRTPAPLVNLQRRDGLKAWELVPALRLATGPYLSLPSDKQVPAYYIPSYAVLSVHEPVPAELVRVRVFRPQKGLSEVRGTLPAIDQEGPSAVGMHKDR